MKQILVIFLTASLVLIPAVAFAGSTSHAPIDRESASLDIMADLLVMRPVGFIALIGGSLAYILTYPAAAVTKSVERSRQAFVTDPYNYTFVRPLGDIRGDAQF